MFHFSSSSPKGKKCGGAYLRIVNPIHDSSLLSWWGWLCYNKYILRPGYNRNRRCSVWFEALEPQFLNGWSWSLYVCLVYVLILHYAFGEILNWMLWFLDPGSSRALPLSIVRKEENRAFVKLDNNTDELSISYRAFAIITYSWVSLPSIYHIGFKGFNSLLRTLISSINYMDVCWVSRSWGWISAFSLYYMSWKLYLSPFAFLLNFNFNFQCIKINYSAFLGIGIILAVPGVNHDTIHT
jgi:hypothetical protein